MAHLFSATLAACLSACGGGGSDNAATPPAPAASTPTSTGVGALRVERSAGIAPDDSLRFVATCTGATSYSWYWGDGSTLLNASASTATHAYSEEGPYTARVVCNGPRSLAGEGSAQVQVTMPVATVQIASSALVAPGQSVKVQAVCANADSYQWNWQDRTSTDPVPTSEATHEYSAVGVYSPQVECRNVRGTVVAKGSASVRVESPKHGIGAVTAYTVRGPTQTATHFNATCTGSHAGAVLSYDWDFGDGSPHSSEANPVHHYATEPERNVSAKLQCTEDRGLAVTSTVTVAMGPSTATPRIESALALEATTGWVGSNFTFRTACAATNGGAISYAYDFGDGLRGDSLGTASHVYAKHGTYRVRATCTQSGGARAIQDVDVVVSVDPSTTTPLIRSALVVESPDGLYAGKTITFRTECVPMNGGSISYSYDFGGGSQGESLGTVTHVFPTTGTYVIQATCTQSGGGSQSQRISVDVAVDPAAKPQIASALAVSAPMGFFIYEFLNFSTTCLATYGGTITYAYTFGDGLGGSSSSNTPSYWYENPGTYPVRVTCTQTGGGSLSQSINVTVRVPREPIDIR